ncbi:MAG: hypothetical protein ACYTFI_13380 [Planctomycetota bacterium]|jgi:hypothetical protein
MPDTAVTVGLWIAAAALSLVSGLLVARSRQRLSAAGILLLRGALLLLIAWLLWLACRSRKEKITSKPVVTEEENVVLFLQDLSQSMAFMTSGGRSRGELAEVAWKDFRELARKEPEGGSPPARPVPRRMFFARNLVDERDSAKIRPDATNMVRALTACLGREEVRAVVVVSDGASTDGAVPGHIVDWARNRDVQVYAVCAADPAGRIADAAVQRTDCPVTNPLRIDAHLTCGKRLSGQMGTLELVIDGQVRQTRRVGLRERASYQLKVPDLARGWHAYAVRVKVDRPEITTLNNVAYGVFRVAPAQMVLYLVGRPRPDHRQAVRVLRGLWPERLQVMYARPLASSGPAGSASRRGPGEPLAAADMNVRNVRLAILADVAPRDVPAPLRRAINGGEVVSMILAGDNLDQWAGRGTGYVPLEGVGEVVQLAAGDTERHGSGAVIATAAGEACGLERLKLDGISLDYIHQADLRSPNEVLLRVKGPERTLPLLVVDRKVAPRCAVLLTDVAWKWALHPEPKVRAAYGDLWHGLTKWILVEDVATAPLDLSFAPDPRDADATLVRVVPGSSAGASVSDLRDVRLVIEDKGGKSAARPSSPKPVRLRLKDGAYVHPYTCRKRPRVVWFQAFAESKGGELRSERKPLALPVSSMELLDVRPHPDRMVRYVPGKDHFAYWRDRANVLKRALEIRASRPVEYRKSPEERKTGAEKALAVVCFLVVACEWLIERRAYAAREASA